MRKQSPVIGVIFWTLVSVLTLFPIYWLFVISVKPAVQLFSTPDVILSDPYWGNYAKVWGDRLLRSYMLNSVIISTGNAVLCTILGFFACYALGIEPEVHLLLVQMDRCAMMDFRQLATRLLGQNRHRVDFFAVWALPCGIDAGKCEHITI